MAPDIPHHRFEAQHRGAEHKCALYGTTIENESPYLRKTQAHRLGLTVGRRVSRRRRRRGTGEAMHHRLKCGVAGSPNSVLLPAENHNVLAYLAELRG